MANFQIANKITGGNEGGWNDTPGDKGGETFAGIARNFWPKWQGWGKIDAYKKAVGSTKGINSLLTDPDMRSLIDLFYKQNFWDVNKLDLVNDQQIADTVYDCGVNSGTGYAAKVLQRACGVAVDGAVGMQTIAAVNSGNAKTIHDTINQQRVDKYMSLAENPTQKQFLKSWLSRIKPYIQNTK